MEYKKKDNLYFIRLDKGEKVVKSLLSFLEKEGIKAGFFNGIGSLAVVELGHYDSEAKEFTGKEFKGKYEIVSFSGNITKMDNKPYIHPHLVVSDRDWKCFGGHCKEAIVGATCEITLEVFDMDVDREFSEEIGLNLLKFT